MGTRHQLAAYSPITLPSIAKAAATALGIAGDPRPLLLRTLVDEYSADASILCGSGTQALQLAITIAQSAGDLSAPVALPAFSCFDIASAAIGANARVVLYDIDPDTLAPNLESLQSAMDAGARTIVVAPLYGIPVDWPALVDAASRVGAVLIEDAAQGHGASWMGRKLGTLANISTLSFGRGKGWTGGNGGAVLLRGELADGRASTAAVGLKREMTTVAATLVQWLLGRPMLYGIPRSIPGLGLGMTTYHAPHEPLSISRAAASGVLANRQASIDEAARRRDNARALLSRIPSSGEVETIRVGVDAEAGYLRLPLRIRGAIARACAEPRARRLGIERSYPISLEELDVLRSRVVASAQPCSGARMLAADLWTLPTHSLITESERNAIIELLSER